MINKIDLVPEDERAKRVKAFLKRYGKVERHFAISAINGDGCRELTYAIMDHVEAQRAIAEPNPETTADSDENADS